MLKPSFFEEHSCLGLNQYLTITRVSWAIDGKTVRGSKQSGLKSAIHLVSAFFYRKRNLLGQIKTEEKSNEITAIPELLKVLYH